MTSRYSTEQRLDAIEERLAKVAGRQIGLSPADVKTTEDIDKLEPRDYALLVSTPANRLDLLRLQAGVVEQLLATNAAVTSCVEAIAELRRPVA